jgi:hypothetical protein
MKVESELHFGPSSFVARRKAGNSFGYSRLRSESHSAMRISDKKFRLRSSCQNLVAYRISMVTLVLISRSTSVWQEKAFQRLLYMMPHWKKFF